MWLFLKSVSICPFCQFSIGLLEKEKSWTLIVSEFYPLSISRFFLPRPNLVSSATDDDIDTDCTLSVSSRNKDKMAISLIKVSEEFSWKQNDKSSSQTWFPCQRRGLGLGRHIRQNKLNSCIGEQWGASIKGDAHLPSFLRSFPPVDISTPHWGEIGGWINRQKGMAERGEAEGSLLPAGCKVYPEKVRSKVANVVESHWVNSSQTMIWFWFSESLTTKF